MKTFNRISYLIGLLLIVTTTTYSQSVFPIVPNSTIASGNDNDVLRTWLEEVGVVPSGTLLYRRSTDGASASAFHTKVDDQGAALVLFKANNGNVFGGFTTASFSSTGGYIASSDAFLFNLTTDRKGDIDITQNSIFNNSNYGPTFGGGHDIYINSSMDGGYFRPSSYRAVDGSGRITNTQIQSLTGVNTTTTGNYSFSSGFITEIEVYNIEFNSSAPVIQGQDITVQLDENGQASIGVDDIDNGTTDSDGTVSLAIDINTFNCDNLAGNSSAITPVSLGSPVNQNSHSLGGSYDPIKQEFLYPQWSGNLVYRYSNDRTFLGTFNMPFATSILDMWVDSSTGDYFIADYSSRLIRRVSRDLSTQVWTAPMQINGSSDGPRAIAVDNQFVYYNRGSATQIAVIDKSTGAFIKTMSLPGSGDFRSMIVANDKLYLVGRTDGWSEQPNNWNSIHVFSVEDLTYESTFSISGDGYTSAVFDGENIWVANRQYSQVYGYQISQGNAYESSGSGSNSVTLTARDPLGNTSSQVFSVTVEDNISPTIALNGNETTSVVIGDTFDDPGATASDNCSANVEVTGTVDLTTQGTYTLTYKAIDGSGNESTEITRTVNVVEPFTSNITTFTDPSELQNDGLLVAASNVGANAQAVQVNGICFDNTPGTLTNLSNGGGDFCQDCPSGSLFDQLFNGLLFQPSGSASSITLTGLVPGNKHRLQLLLSNDVNSTGNNTTFIIEGNPVIVSGWIPNTVNATVEFVASSSTMNIGLASNNGSQANRGVVNAYVLHDLDQTGALCNEPPVVSTGGNITASIGPNGTAIISFDGTGSSDDNGIASYEWFVDGNSVGTGATLDADLGIGSFSAELVITDNFGITASEEFSITVNDATDPIVTTQDITVQLDENGSANITPEQINNGSTDNSGGTLTYNLSQTDFDCDDLGANNVALNFTGGNSSFALVPYDASLSLNSFTVEAWVKTTRNRAYDRVVSKAVGGGQNYSLAVHNGKAHIRFDRVGGGQNFAESPLNVNDGEWHHIAGVHDTDANTIKIFVDGILVDLRNTNGNPVTSSQTIEVGRFSSQYDENFEGDIDEVRVWNTVKTDQEIAENYAKPLVGNEVGLLVYLDFNEGNGSVATNLGTTGDAQLSNNTNWVAGPAALGVEGETKVLLTVTDSSGNAASAFATVTVEDNIFPTLVGVPTDITVEFDALPAVAPVTATDNCPNSQVTFNEERTDGISNNDYTLTRTWNVSDASGNTASAVQIITVRDATAPVVITKDITVQLDANGNASITGEDINDGSSDDSGDVTLSINRSDFDCNDLLGNSLIFDGDNDNVRLSTPINIGQGNSTVEAWVKVPEIGKDGLSANERVGIILGNFSSPNNINYEIHAQGQVRFFWNNGQANLYGTKDLRDGKWHHIAFVRIASENRFIAYIDGQEEFNIVKATSQVSFSSTHRIGGDNRSNPPNFHGNIDELRIWNYARTQSEIASEMLDALKGSESGLLNYWNFEEGSGSTLNDLAGGNNGTLNSMSPSDDWKEGAPNNILIPVELTATDASNNSSSATAMVRVKDDLAPVITPSDITVILDAQGSASISVDDVESMIADNCQIACIEFSQTAFDCDNLGTNTISLIVMDNSFNTTVANISVIVNDKIAPSVVGKPISVTLTASGTVSITADQITDSNSDNCGSVVMSANQTVFGAQDALNSPVTVQLTGTDPSGNATVVDVPITVIDPVPVVATQNITVSLDANGAATITPDQIDNGSSAVVGLSGLALDVSSFDCSNLGVPVTVTLTATSTLGSTASGTATVTVIDEINPTAITQNVIVDLANGGASVTAAQINDGSFDNCEITSMTLDREFFSCEDVGEQTVTLTVTDAAGNTRSANAIVTVRDVTAPFLNVINRTFGLDDNGQLTIEPRTMYNSSNDDCGGPVTVTIDKSSFDCTNLGENVITVTSTDESGNQNIKQAILTIQDAAEPEVNVKDIFTVYLDEAGQASINFADIDTGTRDNCGLDRVEMSRTTFDCNDIGSVLVTTRAFDVNGNMDVNAGQTVIIVEDTIATTVLTQDIVIDLDENGTASITPEMIDAGTYDNCSFILSLSKTSFDCSHVGENTVRLIATSNSGFSGAVVEATAKVTVRDVTAPTLELRDLTVDLQVGAAITAQDIVVASGDNCEVQSITLSKDFFGCEDVGEQLITVTAVDYSGNTTTAQSTITVRDITAPTARAKNRTFGLNDEGRVTITATDIDNFSSDECGRPVTISIDKTEFDCNILGENVVTLTVVDASGNTSTATAVVTIQDASEPVVVAKEIITVYLDENGQVTITPADVDNGSYDNCGIDRLEIDRSSFDCDDIGDQVVTLRAYDVNGNMDVNRGQTIVQVRDNIATTVLTRDIIVDLDANGNATITPEMIDAGTYDNCSFILSLSKTSFDCSNVGENTVRLIATSNSGFSGAVVEATAKVTVRDVTAPVVITQPLTVQLDANGNGSITAEAVNNGSSDACGIASLSLDTTRFFCDNIGTNTVTLTVTDINGNVGTAEATIIVEDNVDPTLITEDIIVQLDETGNFSLDPNNLLIILPTGRERIINDRYLQQELRKIEQEVFAGRYRIEQLGLQLIALNEQLASSTSDAERSSIQQSINDIEVQLPLYEDGLAEGLVELARREAQLEAFENGTILGSTGDACGIVSVVVSQYNFDCSNVGANIVTLTVTDNNGNVSTSEATITVEDNVAPDVITQDFRVELDTNGSATVTTGDIDAGSSDACGIASMVLDTTAFDCSNVGANTVTLTVTDIHGNVSSADATVTIVDAIAPAVITKDITVALDENGEYIITASDIDGGSFDNCTFDLSIDNNAFNCNTLGENIVNLTAIDASGNTTTLPATVTVIDNAAPTIVAQPITVELDENGSASIVAAQVDGGTYDNCAVSSVTIDIDSFTCDKLGENIVTITATDVNGNTASAPVVVTVIDVIAPTVGVQSISVDLDENGVASITPDQVLIYSEADLIRDTECDVTSATSKYVMKVKSEKTSNGSYYNYKSSSKSKGKRDKKKDDDDDDNDDDDDDDDNNSSYSKYIFEGSGSILKRTDGSLLVNGRLVNESNANDSYEITLQLTGAYDYETWTLMRRKAKEVKYETYHYDWTYYNLSSGTLTGNGKNAGQAVSIEGYSEREGFQLGIGANGANINEGLRGKFRSIGDDNFKGELRLDIANCELLPVPEGTVYTDDNCTIVDFSFDRNDFDCNDLTSTTVNLTATDQSGNATTVPVTVRVNDLIAPVAVARDITVSLGANGTVVVDPSLLDGGSTDNTQCGLTFSLDKDTFDCDDISEGHSKGKGKGHNYDDDDDDNDPGKGKAYGHKKDKSQKVTLTVTDASGNSSSATAYITIVDDVAPVIDRGPVTLVVYKETKRKGRRTYTNEKKEYLKDDDVEPLVNDNCDVYKVSFNKTKFGVSNVGLNQVTVTAEDKSGNTTVGSIDVNVVDITSYGSYVEMCYKGKSKRVKNKDVQKYLRKGASIGNCDGLAQVVEQPQVVLNDQTATYLLSRPTLSLTSSPNPTASFTTVTFSSEVAGQARLAVMSTNGVQMAMLFDEELEANTSVSVDYNAGSLQSGIYIIRLVSAGAVKTQKLVVRK